MIDLVLKKKFTYLRASKKLNIKLSTAKLIIKTYAERGAIFDPVLRRNIRFDSEEPVARQESEIEAPNVDAQEGI